MLGMSVFFVDTKIKDIIYQKYLVRSFCDNDAEQTKAGYCEMKREGSRDPQIFW